MTEKDEQLKQFREAVDRKAEAAEAASRAGGAAPGGDTGPVDPATQQDLVDDSRTPDVRSPREKSQGKGQVTADKWNQ